jgi:hypothetical protein
VPSRGAIPKKSALAIRGHNNEAQNAQATHLYAFTACQIGGNNLHPSWLPENAADTIESHTATSDK